MDTFFHRDNFWFVFPHPIYMILIIRRQVSSLGHNMGLCLGSCSSQMSSVQQSPPVSTHSFTTEALCYSAFLQLPQPATLDFRINVQDVYSLFRLFSNLYALIWVYTFINFEKKVPTCTFIPVKLLFFLLVIYSILPIKLGCQPGLLICDIMQKSF